MSLYRRAGSKFWWSKLYVRGSVVRFSTGEGTKTAALRKEREEADKLERAAKAESTRSVATLAGQFLEHAEATNRSPATRAMMERHLATLIQPFLGDHKDASTITIKDVEDYKAMRMRVVKPQTVAKELSTFRQMLRFGGEVLKIFRPGEIPNTRNPRLAKYEPKWRLLTEKELTALVVALSEAAGRKSSETVPYFILLMNTGMRSGEAASLQWGWLDLDKREIHLPAEATKTRTARTVPLNDSALAALKSIKGDEKRVGRVFRYKTHYAAWHNAVRAAGLAAALPAGVKRRTSGIRPHDLRHSYGSLLYTAGTSTPEVRDILGHVTLMMANHYAHTFRERLHTAVNAVNVGVPVTVPLGGQNVPEKVQNGPTTQNLQSEQSLVIAIS